MIGGGGVTLLGYRPADGGVDPRIPLPEKSDVAMDACLCILTPFSSSYPLKGGLLIQCVKSLKANV